MISVRRITVDERRLRSDEPDDSIMICAREDLD